MSKQLPKISIGLPVFNGERYLFKALNALRSQTYTNIEIVILDNNSNDLTEKICTDLKLIDERIKYFKNTTNIGPFPNINKVLTLATGKYYMWASYDDLWDKDYVEIMFKLLEKNSNAILAFSLETRIGEFDENIKTFSNLSSKFNNDDSKFYRVFKFITQNNQESLASIFYGLYNREIISKIGGFTDFQNDYWGRDLHFLLKVLLKGSFTQVNKSLFYKRVMNDKPYSFSQLDDLHYVSKYIKTINIEDNTSRLKLILLHTINDLIKNIHNWNQIYLGYNKIIYKSDFNFFEKTFFFIIIYFMLFKNYILEFLKSIKRYYILKNNKYAR